MNVQLDPFETALLARLRNHLPQTEHTNDVGDTDHVDRIDEAGNPRRWRRLYMGGAAAAAAVAVALVVPGIGTNPAYSVQEGNSGEIVVEVNRPQDAAGLESELAEHGIRADITYVADGYRCTPGRYRPVQRSLSGMTVSLGQERLAVTLPPGTVREDETFVLAVSGTPIPAEPEPSADGIQMMGGFASWTDVDVTDGAAQPCRVIPSDDRPTGGRP